MKEYFGMTGIDAVDCMVSGLDALLETLYKYVCTLDGEEANTITSAVFGLQVYTRNLDEVLQEFIQSQINEKQGEAE